MRRNQSPRRFSLVDNGQDIVHKKNGHNIVQFAHFSLFE